MMIELDPTRLLGMISFGGVALACLVAATRGRDTGRRRFWGVIGLLHAAFCMDVAFNLHYEVAQVIRHLLRALSGYSFKHLIQQISIGLVAACSLIVCVWALRTVRKHGLGQKMAVGATVFSGLTLMIEGVSYHVIDQWMWTHLGPIMLIGWLWLGGALGVGLAMAGSWGRKLEKR